MQRAHSPSINLPASLLRHGGPLQALPPLDELQKFNAASHSDEGGAGAAAGGDLAGLVQAEAAAGGAVGAAAHKFEKGDRVMVTDGGWSPLILCIESMDALRYAVSCGLQLAAAARAGVPDGSQLSAACLSWHSRAVDRGPMPLTRPGSAPASSPTPFAHPRPPPTGDLKNIRGIVQHIAEDGGVMVLPQDAALPGFNEVIRFEPRELVKFFEVRRRPPPRCPPRPQPAHGSCCHLCLACLRDSAASVGRVAQYHA